MVTSLNFYQTTVDTIESVGTVCEGDVINGETLISLIDTYASEETPIYFFYKYNSCVYNIKGNQTDNDSRGVYSSGKYYCIRYNADHLVFVYDGSIGEWGYCHSLPWYDSY